MSCDALEWPSMLRILMCYLSVESINFGSISITLCLSLEVLPVQSYYPASPGLCCPCISQLLTRQAKLSLLSCTSATTDATLQELGLQLHLGDSYLQTAHSDYSTLSEAHAVSTKISSNGLPSVHTVKKISSNT